jgi:hypothetical protein
MILINVITNSNRDAKVKSKFFNLKHAKFITIYFDCVMLSEA